MEILSKISVKCCLGTTPQDYRRGDNGRQREEKGKGEKGDEDGDSESGLVGLLYGT